MIADPQSLRAPFAAATAPALRRDATAPAFADVVYRRYFLGALVLILTAGATWGAWLLWQIGFTGRFTGVSLQHVNAHGHAQIYGWVGLFVMGFAYQFFPRMWHTRLAAPGLAAVAFALMVSGLIVRTIGMTATDLGSTGLAMAMVGGAAEVAAVLTFFVQIVMTFRRSLVRLEPWIGFVLMGLSWFVLQSFLDVWHTYTTMTAATEQQLVWYVATYQAPLRDLQVHGLALFMILGVSLRMLPPMFGVPAVARKRAWRCLALLTLAVVGEVVLFVVYRWTGKHSLAALLMIPWIMLAIGCWMIARPWKLWRAMPARDARSGKYVHAAYAWLALSLVMLLMLPFYQSVSGLKFSHAYYGAIRHAITVGFVSLMIMGMSARMVPGLNRLDYRTLSLLWGPFLLVNAGCALRVTLQVMTDWNQAAFYFVGISGVFEVAGLAWWGLHIANIILRGYSRRRSDRSPAADERTAA